MAGASGGERVRSEGEHRRRHRPDDPRHVHLLGERRPRQMAGRAPIRSAQILLFRSAAAAIVLVPVLRTGGLSKAMWMPRPWLETLRVGLATAETICFYAAGLGRCRSPMPSPTTSPGPIYVTLIAAVLLGEKVGWRRWTAVLVGFGGVLLALQPTDRHLRLARADRLRRRASSTALLMIVTRMLRGTPATMMAAWQIWTATAFRHRHRLVALDADRQRRATSSSSASSASWRWGRSSASTARCAYAPASVVVPLPVHDDRLGDRLRLRLLRRRAGPGSRCIGAAIIVGAGLFIYFRERKVRGEMSKDLVPGP